MSWLRKNWFLLGLFALALFAIPGVILVILRLLEWDADINVWLREHLQITYELRVNPWLALVLLFFPLLLILLYFLKLKRKPIQVPSTFLWKKSIEDLHVNSLFQWLRNNVLLLIQLLVILFLIYSILGVRFHGSTEKSRHFILMIDNSASMAVKDVEPNRLTWAKLEALKEIDAASDNDYGMVIVFNSKATTLQTYTNDRAKLREAVASIQQTQRPTRIEEALALADSLANPSRATEDAAVQPNETPDQQQRTLVQARGVSTVVHLYSDGRFAKLSEAELQKLSLRKGVDAGDRGGLNVRYHMAGLVGDPEKPEPGVPLPGNANNLGIVGMNVLKEPARKKDGAADSQRFLTIVRVANFRRDKAPVKVKLDVLINGAVAHVFNQNIEIRPRKHVNDTKEEEGTDEPGEADARFQLPALDLRNNVVLHASLDKPNDDFALDDQAWLAIGITRKAKVLLVGPPNRVLDAFFDQDATRKLCNTEWMTPDKLKTEEYQKKARSGEFDLVIFDRCAPDDEADMPLANTFFIDRPPPPWQRGTTMLRDPLLMPSKPQQQHPLLRHITTIWEVRAAEAFLFDVEKNLTPKAAAELQLPDGDTKKRTLPAVSRIVEASNQAPILFALPRGPHADHVLTFPIVSDDGGLPTNWYSLPSFPLFFQNVLYILGNVDVRAVSIQSGDPVLLRPEAGFSAIEVTMPPPNKRTLQLPRPKDRNEVVFSETENLGVYSYKARTAEKKDDNEPTRSFAVNLLDVNESNIEPRRFINIGSERLETKAEKYQTREIWKWILLVAVLLLVVEWFVYQRRIAI